MADSNAPSLSALSLAIYSAPNAVFGFAMMFVNAYLLVCFGLGSIVFVRFSLDSRTHARLRAEVDARTRPAPPTLD